MKKKTKQSESFPLNWPPTQSLCWVFSGTAAGGKRGGVGQRQTDLVLNRDQSSVYVLIAGVKRNNFWPFTDLFPLTYHIHHTSFPHGHWLYFPSTVSACTWSLLKTFFSHYY